MTIRRERGSACCLQQPSAILIATSTLLEPLSEKKHVRQARGRHCQQFHRQPLGWLVRVLCENDLIEPLRLRPDRLDYARGGDRA